MKNFARIKDVFLSVTVALAMLFIGAFLVGCGNKYDGFSVSVSQDRVTLEIVDGVCTPKTVVATVKGDASISREVSVSSDASQLNLSTQMTDQGETVITISASAVCSDAVVVVKTLEGNKTATFLVDVEVPVKMISAKSSLENFFVVKGQQKALTVSDFVEFEPKNTTQKDVSFELTTETAYASISNGVLFVSNDYAFDTIGIKATSPHLSASEVLLTLDVLPELNATTVLMQSITYTNSDLAPVFQAGEGATLPSVIELANNLPEKQGLEFVMDVNSKKAITVTPYIKSTLSQNSGVLSFATGQKTEIRDNLGTLTSSQCRFTLSSESAVGDETIYFVVKFLEYNFSYTTPEIRVVVKDSVNKLNMFVDDALSNQTEFTVYDYYQDKKGLKLSFKVLPITVSEAEKVLVLELGINGTAYKYYNDESDLPINDQFVDGKYEFHSDDNVYIAASFFNDLPAQIKIYAKENPAVKKVLNIEAGAGTTRMEFVNPSEIVENPNGASFYYYNLSSNEQMSQDIKFSSDTSDITGLTLEVSGDTIAVDTVPVAKEDYFHFAIHSIKNTSGTSILTLRQANGFVLQAHVRVIYELKKDEVTFSVPSPQTNSAVGLMERQIGANFEFRVAITFGNSITLTRSGLGVNDVAYRFSDVLLEDTDKTDYENFFTNTKDKLNTLKFNGTSQVLDTRFLALDQLKPRSVGQTWVEVTVNGQKLTENIVNGETIHSLVESKETYYFLVEGYIPVSNLSLSTYGITLYSQESVGYSDFDQTTAEVELNFSDATYQNITWLNMADVYQVSGRDVYVTEISQDKRKVTITALSTWKKVGNATVLADSTEFVFTALVKEFNKEYRLALKLTIKKAVQVEKILVENVNTETGIYIPLTYDGKDITRKISAVVQIGESGQIPFNTKLVYEFLPYISSEESSVSLDRDTGLLTISKDASHGDAGIIRIAPADRYNRFNQYEAGNEDVAVYLQLVVADGNSRATSYRITSLADILDIAKTTQQISHYHYTLMNDIVIREIDSFTTSFAITNLFEGGLYGCVEGDDRISVITTEKTLFGVLSEKAVIEDLVLCGVVSGTGFVADENYGTIENVKIVSQSQETQLAKSSVLSAYAKQNTIGGIVGVNAGLVSNSSFAGQIVGSTLSTLEYVGGIAGENRGKIENCAVEFCAYFESNNPFAPTQNYDKFDVGSAVVGGLVGKLSDGQVLKSYVYSYVPISKAQELIISLSPKKGVLFGEVVGGLADECFGSLQNHQNLYGEMVGENKFIKNAYINYKETDESIVYGQYYNNFELIGYYGDPTTFNALTNQEIWDRSTTPASFVNVKAPQGVSEILEVFKNSDTVFSSVVNNGVQDVSTAMMFMYNTEESLTKQEQIVLNALNYYTFEDLFNGEVYGINAFTSNTGVIKASVNGLTLVGTGFVEVTFYSKYNADISKTYSIYVINPICQPVFDIGSTQFLDGYILNIKTTESLGFALFTNNTKLLDARQVEYNITPYDVMFENPAIVGSGMGPYSVNTEMLSIGRTDIAYSLQIQGTGYDSEISALLGEKYKGQFAINLYKGADAIKLSTSEIVMEPFDENQVEITVFTDVSLAEGENIEVALLENKDFPNVFEDNLVECIGVTYFADASMQTVLADEVGAKYFAYVFKVKLVVKDEYKSLSFGQAEFVFKVSAASSVANHSLYGFDIVETTFTVKIIDQEILSVTTNHFERTNKSVLFNEETHKNFVFYEYDTSSSTNVISPGQEGLLKYDIYPNYARYDYIDVTYSVLTEYEANIMFYLLEPYKNGNTKGFIESSLYVENLENGIRIFNNQENTEEAITTIYLGTYLPISTSQDAVFEILFTAVSGSANTKQSRYNLVVEYLEDATVQVVDNLGQVQTSLPKGTTANLLITLPKEQSLTLDYVNILGVKNTPNPEGLITLARTQIIEDEHSLTRTYRYALSIGSQVEMQNNANYVTIEVTVSWIVNGKMQKRISTHSLGIVDFKIENVTLLTDKADKSTFYTYIGVESNLQFDFNGNQNQSTNDSFNKFLNDFYFESISEVNNYGNYIVNYGKSGQKSFLGNLYYQNGSTYYPLLNIDGSYEANNYFNFIEKDGTIILTGKRQGEVNLRFNIEIQYPNPIKTTIYEINFDFTVVVVPFSDEDLPLIIDNQNAFLDALNSDTPQDYILMSDIYLTDYTPLATNSILSLDGNNYAIHIMSYETETLTNALNLALFSEVAETTTIKNLTVNLYNLGTVVVNTNQVQEVNFAGLALENNGIIYNSGVTVYKNSNNHVSNAGINLDFGDYVGQGINTKVAGFVLTNNGYITNSRVGDVKFEKVASGLVFAEVFNITSQGAISGFVHTNAGTIASSYFANGTLTNTSIGGAQTTTSGFATYNSGTITGSYAKGTGEKAFSLTGQGITTSSIGVGFIATNNGTIEDCYSNILLATKDDQSSTGYQAGRFSAGFVYQNQGTIQNAFTASKIENAKTTQMSFVGVDDTGNILNSGKILHSYYYNDETLEGDAYSTANSNMNIVRISEPNNPDKFYGFSFADSATSFNGVWFSNSYGIDLVSANQIAVSNRYVANEKRDSITGELISYNLPYTDGYNYGSAKNPIIIRSAEEFNRASGGDDLHAGTAISAYYNLANGQMYGNYRIIANINLKDLNPDNTQAVSLRSTQMSLYGAVIDGNQLTISGVDITAQTDSLLQNFGLFKELSNGATIKNLKVSLIAVSAKQARFVGALAGTVDNSKVIGIKLTNTTQNQDAIILGNNVVGGLVGLAKGDSQIKNIEVSNLSIKANALATGASQHYNRNLSNLPVVNNGISYAGGVIGVADIYTDSEKTSLLHKTDTQVASLANLEAKDSIQVRASTVGGVIGYLGPQTNLKDTSFVVGLGQTSKLVAYNFFAGGIVGQCYGNIDMATTEHEESLQKEIENSVSEYYHSPNSNVQRGSLKLFDDTSDGNIISTYIPVAVGGIVGSLITGDITHSYSKINVINQEASFAGGIVGQIADTTSPLLDRNKIAFFEVYAFGDVYAGNEDAGIGGIVGFVDSERRITMAKVNAVNYWGLEYNDKTQTYSVYDNAFEIYAKTNAKANEVNFVDEVVDFDLENNSTTVHTGFTLPTIVTTTNAEDMFVVTAVKFNQKGSPYSDYIRQSFACLMGEAPYNMAFDPYYGLQDNEKTSTSFISTQSVTPYYDLTDPATNGIAMDTYFIQANWDTNYWVRYSSTNDLLPSLVTYSESMSYYIDVAQDLQKMLYHPYATFIVRALNQPSTIIPVGDYIASTGIALNNFAGTLKGLDESQNYGFDFQGKSSFIKATTGASFYSLTIERIGDAEDSVVTQLNQAFVDNASLTSFENMTFKNCYLTTEINENNFNIGVVANKMLGGFLNNISVENCAIKTVVKEGLSSAQVPIINVGLVVGQLETNSGTLLQMTDVCVYQTPNETTGSYQNTGNNNILFDVNGQNLDSSEVNLGAIVGETLGNVVCGYSSVSATGKYTKGIGIATGEEKYTAGTNLGIKPNGTEISVLGTGTVKDVNAGLMFGKVNAMNIGFNRLSENQKLQIVGGIVHQGDALGTKSQIQNANLGGLIGKVETTASVQNTSSSRHKFIEVDVNLNAKAQNINAGMLIGLGASIFTIDNIDTFGNIVIDSGSYSNVGGFVGVVNSTLNITNSISQTNINISGQKSAVGGLVGMYSALTGTLEIGDSEFNTKYLGNITVKSDEAVVGGILGAAKTQSNVASVNVNIQNVVFGGNIVFDEMTGSLYAGGIMGTTKASGSEASPKVELVNCLSYGDISILYDYASLEGLGKQVFVGGLIGKASETTTLSGNTALVTLASKTSLVLEGVYINALVGDANGAKSGIENPQNYYSHQISLCIDLNQNIGATNLYYKRIDLSLEDTDPKRSKTINDIITAYTSQMTEVEKLNEYYVGSKLNPIEIDSMSKLVEHSALISGEKQPNKEIFVLFTKAFSGAISGIDVVGAHILGDGYSITNTSSLFASVDANSSVAGVEVVPTITSPVATTISGQTGVGALANINNGFVFACSVKTEDISAHNHTSLQYTGSGYMGGIVGINNGVIMDSMSSINIQGNGNAGGVVGYNAGNIVSSYSVGTVENGYSFGVGSGAVYSSYTASPATKGVFGTNQKIVDSYYDLYATGHKYTAQTTSDTNTLSVLDSVQTQNITEATVEDRNKDTFIFTASSNQQKFDFVVGQNFGYPTFSGPAYKTLSYMQGIETGTGTTDNPILINSVGKLQQISKASAKNLNYKLVCDIEATSAMKSMFDEMVTLEEQEDIKHFDKAFEVADWEPITGFQGTLTGKYGTADTQVYTIKNLTSTRTHGSWAIFGETISATFKDFNVEYASLEIETSNLAGLATGIDGITADKVNLSANSISTTATGSVKIAGMFGQVLASTQDNAITNCSLAVASLGATDSVSGAVIGGLASEMVSTTGTGKTTLEGIKYNSALSVSVDSSGENTIGGLVGKAQNLSIASANLGTVALSTKGTGSSVLGGLFGVVLGGAFDAHAQGENSILVAGTTITTESTGKLTAGGIAGSSNETEFKNLITGTTITNSSNGANSIGAIVGYAQGGAIIGTSYELSKLSVTLSSASSTADNYIGGLVGVVGTSATIGGTVDTVLEISKQFVLTDKGKGTVHLGGIAGQMNTATVSYINITDIDFAGEHVGAVAGDIDGGTVQFATIKDCDMTAEFYGSGTNLNAYGGMISGKVNNGTLQEIKVEGGLVKTADIPTSTTPVSHLGGFAGAMSGTINGTSSSSASIAITTGGFVGGIIGECTGETNIDNTTSTGSISSNLATSQIGKPLAIGGFAGEFKGRLTASARSGSSISVNAPAYVGGIAGIANGTFEGNSMQSSVSEHTKVTANSTPSGYAVGGLVGKATNSIFKSNIVGGTLEGSNFTPNAGVQVVGTFVAGGLVGEAESCTFSGSQDLSQQNINGATVKSANGTPANPILITVCYAGGIVGLASGGSMTYCTNFGEVTAGWKHLGTDKLVARDFYYLIPDLTNNDDEKDQNLVKTKLKNKVRSINEAVQGVEQSYAGGICGSASGMTTLNNVTNSARVIALADVDLTLNTSDRYENWTSYDSYLHYGYELEKANAAGIVPNDQVIESGCVNNGAIVGGGKTEFNAYSHDDSAWTNKYATYLVNYSFDISSTGAYSNIKNYFEPIFSGNENAVSAWVEHQNDPGIKLVGANGATNEFYEWGDPYYEQDPYGDNGVVIKTNFDSVDYTDSDLEIDESLVPYTFLHYTSQLAGIHDLSEEGVTEGAWAEHFVYPEGTEFKDGLPVYYFVIDINYVHPDNKQKSFKVNSMYQIIYCQEDADTDYREIKDPETNEVIDYEEIKYDAYYFYTPEINYGSVSSDSVSKGSITCPGTPTYIRYTDAEYSTYKNMYENKRYKSVAMPKQIVIYKEGGPCTFPVSSTVDTQMYSYNLSKSQGGIFGATETTPFKFRLSLIDPEVRTLSDPNLQLVDLQVVSDDDAANSVEVPPVGEYDGESAILVQATWGTDATFFDLYGGTEYDRGKAIWKFYTTDAPTVPRYLHWENNGSRDILTCMIGGVDFILEKIGAATDAEKYNYQESETDYQLVATNGTTRTGNLAKHMVSAE